MFSSSLLRFPFQTPPSPLLCRLFGVYSDFAFTFKPVVRLDGSTEQHVCIPFRSVRSIFSRGRLVYL